MKPINRLQRLLVVLREVRDTPSLAREFDLSHWVKEVYQCGTHFCAVGWGACDPILKKEGLRLSRPTKKEQEWTSLRSMVPAFGKKREWAAVESFFGLTEEEAENLFHPGNYSTNTDINLVIERVRRQIQKMKRQKR